MDIQLQKLELIQWITSLNDEKSILSLDKIRKSQQKDWWMKISDDEKTAINIGLNDAENGRLTPHSEVKKMYEKWI